MKKFFLPFLSLMGVGFPALAQSHINIELLSATYTTPAVQFRVSWSSVPTVTGQTHNAKVWLWVDFIKIENNQPSGSWTRATVANPSPGTVAPETNKGFWLQGNSGNYNQIVTVALANIPANTIFNWCAYASDCPPNASANNGTYTFKGTPPFTLIESNGITTQTVNETTLATSALTITPTTIRDKTECPGVFCPYQGSDLHIDATHLCQQRTSGAQNWEAYIKDHRDDQIYRITQFTDGAWWFADNLSIEEKRIAICDGISQYYGSNHPDCPTGWQIPSRDELTERWVDYSQVVNDPYGGTFNNTSLYIGLRCYGGSIRWDRCVTTDELSVYDHRGAVVSDVITVLACATNHTWGCHCTDCIHESNHSGVIRCKRQL